MVILSRLKNLDLDKSKEYIVNTSIVARQRSQLFDRASKQLDQNPNKARKVEAALLKELKFEKTLQDCLQNTKDELGKLDSKIS